MLKNWFTKKQITGKDTWMIAQGVEDNLPLLFRVRNQKPTGTDPANYPCLIVIHWHFKDASNRGMPTRSILSAMIELEERLDTIEGPACGFFMVSITGNLRKEWFWYTCDQNLFTQELNQALAGHGTFPIEIYAEEDPSWQAYKNIRVCADI